MGPSSGTWVPPLLQEGTNRHQIAGSCKAAPKPGIPPDVRIQRVVRVREAGKELARAIRDEYRQKKGTGRARVVEGLRGQWEHDMQQRVAHLSLQLRRAMVAVGTGHRLAVDHTDELEHAASESRQLQERRRLEEARRAVMAHRVRKSQYEHQVERHRALSLQRNQIRQELSHRDREVAHHKAAEQARVEAWTAEARKTAEAKSRDSAVTVVKHQEQNVEQAGIVVHDFSKTRFHAKVIRHGTNGGGVHDDVTRLREDLEGHRAAREAREKEQKRQAELRQKHAARREHSAKVLRNVEHDLESLAVLDRRRKQHKGMIVQRGAIVPQSAGRKARHEERQRCAATEEVLLASVDLNGPEPRSSSTGPRSVGQSRPAVCLHPGRPPPPPLTDLEWMRPSKAPVVQSVEVEDDQSQHDVQMKETEGDGNKLTPYQGVDQIRARISALRQQLDVEMARDWKSVDSPSTLGSSPAAPPRASNGSSPAHAEPESSGAGIGIFADRIRPYAKEDEEEQVPVEADEEPRADIPRPTPDAVSSHSELALPAASPPAEGHVEVDRAIYELPAEAITEKRFCSEHPEQQEQSEALMTQPEAPLSLAGGPVAAVDISTALVHQRRSSSTDVRAAVPAQEASTEPAAPSNEPTSAVDTDRVEGAEGGADGGYDGSMIVRGKAVSQQSRLTPPDDEDQAEQGELVITHCGGLVERSRRGTDDESEQPLLRAMEELANHLRDRRLHFDPKVDALMEQQRKLREAMEVTRKLEQDQLRRQASGTLELDTGVLPPASAAVNGADVTIRGVTTARESTTLRQGSTALGGGVGGSDELSSLGAASDADSDLTSDHDSQLGQALSVAQAQGGQVALGSQGHQSPSTEQDTLSGSLSSSLYGGSQFLGSEGLRSEGQIVEMSLSEGDLEIASYPSSWRQLCAGAAEEEVVLHDLNVQGCEVELDLLMLIEQELDADGDMRQAPVDVGSVHRSASASSRSATADSV